jgi:hypothetical protein
MSTIIIDAACSLPESKDRVKKGRIDVFKRGMAPPSGRHEISPWMTGNPFIHKGGKATTHGPLFAKKKGPFDIAPKQKGTGAAAARSAG